jgi:hypothetical protein
MMWGKKKPLAGAARQHSTPEFQPVKVVRLIFPHEILVSNDGTI